MKNVAELRGPHHGLLDINDEVLGFFQTDSRESLWRD
jgi:hypothetical protein